MINHLRWLLIPSFFLAFIPFHTGKERLVNHSHALVIQTSKTSPPRIAFQETIASAQAPLSWVEQNEGRLSRVDLTQVMSRESKIKGLKTIRYKKMILKPLQIDREAALRILDNQVWLEKLPVDQKRRLQLADSDVVNEDWSLPSIGKMFQEKIQEIKDQVNPSRRPKVIVETTDTDGNKRTPDDLHREADVVAEPDANIASRGGKLLVSGHLSLDPEAALGPDRHIEVHWLDDGVKQETGQVEIGWNKSNYSIWLPNKSGTVVAQVVDTRGTEVGAGEFRILGGAAPESLKNASIHIRPRQQVVRNFYDFGSEANGGNQYSTRNVASAKSNRTSPRVLISSTSEEAQAEGPHLRVAGLAPESWTFLRTEQKGYYPSLFLANAGKEKALPLFPEKMMQALLEIVRSSQGAGYGETGAIIWGKITQGNRGAAGVEVEIEGMPDAKPIYFFSELLLPDEKSQTTSGNGYFAFVDLPRGFYSLLAHRGQQQVGVVNVEVDEHTVSPVEIASDSVKEKIPVKSFDAFSGSPQSVQVEFQHLPEAVQIQGFAEVDLPVEDKLSLVQVKPQDPIYLETVQVFSGNQDHLHLPLVRQDWLMSLKATMKISEAPETGTIVGFVLGDDYEVDLPHAPDFDRHSVVYFDAQGMPSPVGVAGGGFVVFNAPPGSHTVVLLPKKSNVLHSQVTPVDPNTFNILKFDL